MLEHGHRNVGRKHRDPPLRVADARIAAIAEHCPFERDVGRVVVRLLDFGPEIEIGERSLKMFLDKGELPGRKARAAAQVAETETSDPF